MTATLDHSTNTITSAGPINVRGEAPFLTAETYALTAREIVYVLAGHLARYGDTLAVDVVDPLHAIDAYMRFDAGASGDLTGWTIGRTPTDVALILARAEHIARDYFGTWLPAIRW